MDEICIQVLGRVAFVRDGRSDALPRAQARGVLALLALNAGRVVSLDQVAAAMWGGDEPATARAQIHTAVSSIRRLIAAAGTSATVAGGRFGYELTVDPSQVDALLFEQMVRRHSADAADPQQAAARLREALALWRGEPLADAAGAFVDGVRHQLLDRRLTAVDDLAALDLALGRAAEVAAELTSVVAEHPSHERLRGRLMTALYRSGRQAEALRLYHDYRRWIAEGEGLDPGADLTSIAEAILRDRLPAAGPHPDRSGEPAAVASPSAPDAPAEATPAAPAPAATTPAAQAAAAGAPAIRPAGLPGATSGFVGRANEIRWLTEEAGRDRGSAAVYAIVGTGGAGKTALAVHWGQQKRSHFPDGQLYVNMHGYSSGPPLTPLDALGRFLRALDVPGDRVPSDVDEAAALYRSVLADRRILVLLDNVRGADQIRPLLPGSPGCVTLVTSRDSLDALVAVDGARRLDLDVLPLADAIALLSGLLGEARVRAEPTAAADLAAACACLPLAMRITAAQLTARPRRTLAQHSQELRTEDRLGALALGDDAAASVAATLDYSYQTLPAHVARLYRLLGLSPAPDLDAWGLAALAGQTVADAASLAHQLKAAHLIFEVAPERFAMHDLVRLHAARQAERTDPDTAGCEAVTRLVEWYADTAVAANVALAPMWQPPEWSRALPPVNPLAFGAESQALAWLDREQATLVVLTRYAAQAGVGQAVLPLAQGQFAYQLRHHLATTMVDLNQLSWDVATRLADDAALAASAQSLGVGYSLLNRTTEAVSWYERALAYNTRLGLDNRVARTHMNLGAICSDSGQLEQAVHHLQLGLAISRRIGDAFGESHALGNLAYAYQQMRQWELAEQTFTEAIAVQRRTGNRHGECLAEGNLGAAYLEQERYDDAATHVRAGLELAEELGDQLAIARDRTLLGDIHLAGGDLVRARAEWQDALRIFLDLDHPEAAEAQDRLRDNAIVDATGGATGVRSTR